MSTTRAPNAKRAHVHTGTRYALCPQTSGSNGEGRMFAVNRAGAHGHLVLPGGSLRRRSWAVFAAVVVAVGVANLSVPVTQLWQGSGRLARAVRLRLVFFPPLPLGVDAVTCSDLCTCPPP